MSGKLMDVSEIKVRRSNVSSIYAPIVAELAKITLKRGLVIEPPKGVNPGTAVKRLVSMANVQELHPGNGTRYSFRQHADGKSIAIFLVEREKLVRGPKAKKTGPKPAPAPKKAPAKK